MVLKTLEGTAMSLFSLLKDAFMSSTKTKIAAALVKNDLKDVGDLITPEQISKIEECIKDLEVANQGDDSSKITEKLNALSEAHIPVTEALSKKNETAKQDNTVVDVEATPAV